MAAAAVAIVVAVTGLCLWVPTFAGYHHAMIPAIYLALVVVAATVTTVSAVRGTRAARSLHTGA
jgi:cytochrome b subunit of formate dehydrogenase